MSYYQREKQRERGEKGEMDRAKKWQWWAGTNSSDAGAEGVTREGGAQVTTVLVSDKEEAANEVRCEYHTKRLFQTQ